MELSASSRLGEEIGPASQHPSELELQRLMRGDLTRDEARIVVRHLLRGCPKCTRITRRFWWLGHRPPEPEILEA